MSNVIVTPKHDEEIEKIKDRPLFKQIRRWYSQFMNSSTIHGLKYLVDNEKSVIEKIWWICILLLSTYTCAVLIKLTWQKWEENPVITAFRQNLVPLWDIPFPAVTVCYGYLHKKESIVTFLSSKYLKIRQTLVKPLRLPNEISIFQRNSLLFNSSMDTRFWKENFEPCITTLGAKNF
ncbi:hypothetical protein Zmor_013554 [Zophobas morio]|uniref:Uncharacterized protein n=1 Tax=Zophobas morio TaxID=2755281 RepID=A0AA38ID77_9CUCU|nr:hypothetical protein Zmor_013554 [Zophobas morio]